ncbi:MAG: hypothetical protein HFG56_05895 [Lachnospiraceae bacterium]|nr:hypothetical protein [Lachnospiraceae bacterium]MCI9282809.1 hypothetical protein [Lachnospiraceae bacterium]
MKVTARSWSADASSQIYSSSSQKEEDTKKAEYRRTEDPDTDRLLDSLKSLSTSSAKKENNNFKMRSTKPEDSVGQLASMLARAETRIDVQQVASRAIRSLTSLKMSLAASEGNDAKKIAQMIKRMEKLIKRIQKKLQHLSKEEQLENRKKRAEKNEEEQLVKEIQKELNTRRKKRRRDERNYANKEMAEDAKNSSAELYADMMNAISPGSATSIGSSMNIGSAAVPDIGGVSADVAIAESVSIDISV